jgi:hypothetical protein
MRCRGVWFKNVFGGREMQVQARKNEKKSNEDPCRHLRGIELEATTASDQ